MFVLHQQSKLVPTAPPSLPAPKGHVLRRDTSFWAPNWKDSGYFNVGIVPDSFEHGATLVQLGFGF